MGDDLTKSYRPYIVVGHSSTQRQILCDTQTDGGGWVVIQVGTDNRDMRNFHWPVFQWNGARLFIYVIFVVIARIT